MATIKSYTDIEQSKKLAEILSLESADMYYAMTYTDAECNRHYNTPARIKQKNSATYETDIPCWSLAALLGVIPKHIKDYNVLRIDISNDFAIWYDEIGSGVNNDLPDITADNPVDACYEMIIKLNKLKILLL